MQSPEHQLRRLEPGPTIICAEVRDEAVLLETERGIYYTLNAVAARTWQLSVQGLPLARVRGALLSEFDVTEAQLTSDLDRFVDDMARLDLARIVNG